MTKRINIPRERLYNFYINQKLSTHKIAKIFKCNPTAIQNRLKKYNIKTRKPKKKIKIPKEKIYELYVKRRFSVTNVAKILGISHCCTYYKLIENRIQPRKKNLLKISKEDLYDLYAVKNLSPTRIGRMYGFDKSTIFEKLKKYNIKTKSISEANTIYPKKKFLQNKKLKAYMIGFRLGDLHVRAKNKDSTIFISSNTTKKEQLDLIKDIYGRYGHFKFKDYNGLYCIYYNLDKSFNFLIKKEDNIESWILNNKNNFLAFLGGYTDAEGTFGVYQNRARFRVGSYDKNIIKQIKEKLDSLDILTKFRLETNASKKRRQNQDFYRTSINEKNSLLRFIKLIKPHIKHSKRYRDLIRCENNVLERNKKYQRTI